MFRSIRTLFGQSRVERLDPDPATEVLNTEEFTDQIRERWQPDGPAPDLRQVEDTMHDLQFVEDPTPDRQQIEDTIRDQQQIEESIQNQPQVEDTIPEQPRDEDTITDQQRALRVAIVGNSNSVMKDSYSHMLAQSPEFSVTNKSIGSTPSVLLLDFLALEQDLDFDFLIIETAVCDAIMSHSVTRERAQETLEIFISSFQARSNAQIIILAVPTQMAILTPGAYWQESLHRDIAARFRLPILDGFELIRDLVGRVKMSLAARSIDQARRLGLAFGLPEQLFQSLAWRSLRDRDIPSNALGQFGFNDQLHLSRSLHALVFVLLRQFMIDAYPVRAQDDQIKQDNQIATETNDALLIIAAPLKGGTAVTRRNSWITRNLALLSRGETGRYECPPAYRAFGLLLNTSNTSCFLRVTSPAGQKTIDLHHLPQPTNWVALITPIGDDIGGGDIDVEPLDSLLSQTEAGLAPSGETTPDVRAELGELILVRRDWRDCVAPIPQEAAPVLSILRLPWAKPMISKAAAQAAPVIYSMESQGQFVDESLSRFITSVLTKARGPLSRAEHARLLLAMGRMKELTPFLEDALRQQPEDAELLPMASALRAIEAEDSVQQDELLQRAREKVGSGAIGEAEALYEEGMARFTREVQFWFQHASLAQHRQDWAEATRRWEMMQELFPSHESWCVGLCLSLQRLGRIDEAERTIESVIAMHPTFADAAAVHALIPLDRKDSSESLRRLRSVRKRFPDQLRNRKALIDLLIEKGSFSEARQELTDIVQENRANRESMSLAIKLAEMPQGFEWIASVWEPFARSVPDRPWLTGQSLALFERFSATHDCDFLLPWLPESEDSKPWRDERQHAVGG